MTTRKEKLEEAGIRKYGSLEAYKAELARRGSRGGKTTGESKLRGGKEYYSTIGKKGAQVRHGENA